MTGKGEPGPDPAALAEIDAGAIEIAMARIKPVASVVIGVAILGLLVGVGAALLALTFAIGVVIDANNSGFGPDLTNTLLAGVGMAFVYLIPIVPLFFALFGALQALRVRSFAWARGAAVALVVSGALMPLLVGVGTYCVGLCPSLVFSVIGLTSAGYLLGVLSDPAVARAFELSRQLEESRPAGR